MKIRTQANAALTQLAELIEPLSMAVLTVTDDDDARSSCRLTPLEMDSTGGLWFFVDLRSPMVEHMSSVELAFGAAGRSTCVWLSGRGEVTDDPARIARLWTASAAPCFPDGPRSPDLLLLKVVAGTAEYWDAPNARLVDLFAPAAPVAARSQIGLGSHDAFSGLSRRSPQLTLR